MAVSTTAIRVTDLPARQLSALKRKARQLGVSPETYIRHLIEQDLALDEQARRTSLHDLAVPFRKAFSSASDTEIDAVVNAARRRRSSRSKRGKSR
jgi:hypothetical protein